MASYASIVEGVRDFITTLGEHIPMSKERGSYSEKSKIDDRDNPDTSEEDRSKPV